VVIVNKSHSPDAKTSADKIAEVRFMNPPPALQCNRDVERGKENEVAKIVKDCVSGSSYGVQKRKQHKEE